MSSYNTVHSCMDDTINISILKRKQHSQNLPSKFLLLTIWFFLIKYHIWGLNRIYSDLLLLNNKNNCLILKILTIINEMHIQYPFGIILLGVVVDERTQAYKNTGTLLRSHSTSKGELQISWFSLDDSSEIAWDAPYISIYRKHF